VCVTLTLLTTVSTVVQARPRTAPRPLQLLALTRRRLPNARRARLLHCSTRRYAAATTAPKTRTAFRLTCGRRWKKTLSMLRLCARCVLCFNFSEAEFRDWLRATLAADTDDVVANMWDNTLAAAYTKLMHVQSPSSSEALFYPTISHWGRRATFRAGSSHRQAAVQRTSPPPRSTEHALVIHPHIDRISPPLASPSCRCGGAAV
jgi:hypothetical protein